MPCYTARKVHFKPCCGFPLCVSFLAREPMTSIEVYCFARNWAIIFQVWHSFGAQRDDLFTLLASTAGLEHQFSDDSWNGCRTKITTVTLLPFCIYASKALFVTTLVTCSKFQLLCSNSATDKCVVYTITYECSNLCTDIDKTLKSSRALLIKLQDIWKIQKI